MSETITEMSSMTSSSICHCLVDSYRVQLYAYLDDEIGDRLQAADRHTFVGLRLEQFTHSFVAQELPDTVTRHHQEAPLELYLKVRDFRVGHYAYRRGHVVTE